MKIIKIGAIWCPECLIMRPRWMEIEKELAWLNLEHIEIDERPDIKEKYNIDHIPTVIFLDDEDNEVFRLKGLVEKEDLIARIEDINENLCKKCV